MHANVHGARVCVFLLFFFMCVCVCACVRGCACARAKFCMGFIGASFEDPVRN